MYQSKAISVDFIYYLWYITSNLLLFSYDTDAAVLYICFLFVTFLNFQCVAFLVIFFLDSVPE